MNRSVLSHRLPVLMGALCIFAVIGCSQSQLKTSITLSSSSTMIQRGSSVVLTATVGATASKGSPARTGMVTFYDGPTSIGTGTLANDTATLTSAPYTTAGSHSLTATYEGNSDYQSVTSLPVTLTVM